MKRFARLGLGWVLAYVWLAAIALPADGQEALEEIGALGEEAGRQALEPPDTSSPRATLRSFLENGREAWEIFLETGNPSREVYARAGRRVQRAARCLDLSEVPPAAQTDVGGRATILLLDVFERISLPYWRDIPDSDAVAEGLTEWTVPHTPIVLQQVTEGPRAGEFLFTPKTVSRADEFYRMTRHLKPRANAVVDDGFKIYRTLPGWMIPLSWVRSLPGWARATVFHQAVWQWLLLGVVISAALSALYALRRWALRAAEGESWLRPLVVPVVLLVGGYFFSGSVIRQIGFKGNFILVADLVVQGVMVLVTALLGVRLVKVAGERIAQSPRVHERSIDAHLVRLAARVVGLLVALLVVVEGARVIGLPIAGLIAGLGVGGVAVALAAQSTIENFIGSLTIFADRPVRVGDFCRFGDEVGTVEEIGLRSTRVRTLGRSLMTIPNSEFSRLRLDNYTQRDGNLLKATIALRYETTPEQLRRVLEDVRGILEQDDRVRAGARVRLVGPGTHAFELEVFAVVEAPDWADFVAIREDLWLRILDAVDKAGARLAVPAQTAYLSRDPLDPRDAEGAGGAEA